MHKKLMGKAFQELDRAIDKNARLIIGGGAAMVLAYDHPLATQDVDAFCAKGGLTIADLDQASHAIAKKLDIDSDWLNAHFLSFTHVLPSDFVSRLRPVFRGRHLTVEALGPEDILVMKCFAGRDKDRPHAKKLIHLCSDLSIVDDRLSELADKGVLGAEAAADFFDDLRDEEGL